MSGSSLKPFPDLDLRRKYYYPFGLKIAGISSVKFDAGIEGSLKNNILYNDKELWDDADLDWYDYGFRNYDAQIGRFPQLDPLTDGYPYYTPYQYAGNEPIANVDMDGLEEASAIISEFIKEGGKPLQEIVVKGLSHAAPAATKVGTSILSKAGTALNAVGKGIGWFANGLWNEGVMPSLDWFNHNLNPVYGVFNGVNSQFTGQDFFDRTPMSRGEGVTQVALSVIPGMKVEGAIGKGVEKLLITQEIRSAAKTSTNLVEQAAVHGNSLKSLKPTWGYKLFSNDGTFLKNGITNKLIPETRYTKAFMSDKYMEAIPFPNRLGAYQWEFGQNQILRGPLNFNMH